VLAGSLAVTGPGEGDQATELAQERQVLVPLGGADLVVYR
jgi:hypothetical protein